MFRFQPSASETHGNPHGTSDPLPKCPPPPPPPGGPGGLSDATPFEDPLAEPRRNPAIHPWSIHEDHRTMPFQRTTCFHCEVPEPPGVKPSCIRETHSNPMVCLLFHTSPVSCRGKESHRPQAKERPAPSPNGEDRPCCKKPWQVLR